MEELLKGDIIKYGIIIATVLSVTIKVIQTFIYIKLMEESENIPASRNKLIKQMKLKFENCYKLNLGVNNVHIFVDKYMYKHKIGRISMYHLNRIPIVAGWLCATIGIASGCICYLQNYSVKMGTYYEIYGIGSILILKLADVILDTTHKKEVAYTNLIDFFENSLKNHFTHDMPKVSAVSEEEREMIEEIPIINEIRTEKPEKSEKEKGNKEIILQYYKKEKNKNPDPQTVDTNNAEDIIQDVLSQFLS